MKPTLKVFLIGFIATSVPYGIFTYYLEYSDYNGNEILWKPVISAVFFGLLMAFFFILMQKKRLKKAGYPKLTNDLLKLKQEKTIEAYLTKEELINLLKNSNDFKKCKYKSNLNSIIMRKKMSWFSWGEKITITFTKADNKIKIESKPSMPTTLIDYGVNIENIDNVIKVIKTV